MVCFGCCGDTTVGTVNNKNTQTSDLGGKAALSYGLKTKLEGKKRSAFRHSSAHYSKYCPLPRSLLTLWGQAGSRTCCVKSLRHTVHSPIITFCCCREREWESRKMERRGKHNNKAECSLAKDQAVQRERLLITFLCVWNCTESSRVWQDSDWWPPLF